MIFLFISTIVREAKCSQEEIIIERWNVSWDVLSFLQEKAV